MNKYKIGVIGLGYVGLPLAVEFGKKYNVIGFDIHNKRILELKEGKDSTLEVDSSDLSEATKLSFSSDSKDLFDCNIYIVTVPTPIDNYNKPDLRPLYAACNTVGKALSKNDIVIFESTVYPGCTEEDCVPVLEKYSGLTYKKDFFCGYSPERINPGDKEHRLTNITKIVSGSSPEVAADIDELYSSIIEAGTFIAESIKVAEAAKVIENSQRDINIAFVNELSIIFEKMGIDTTSVLNAAGTKWNFLNFRPGLVGGHCIGVDPYYLTHKAESLGYHSQIILSGRKLNDSMPSFIANKVVKLMIKKGINVYNSSLLLLGITFKENCPDIRNSKVFDLYKEFIEFGINVDVYDPWADKDEVKKEYDIDLLDRVESSDYDSVILAVAHKQYEKLEIKKIIGEKSVIYDIKGSLIRTDVDARL